MAEMVETTGRTVELALAAALKKLGKSADEVQYEVLAQPSRGFLGLIGNKPARLRVTVKEVSVGVTAEKEPVLAEATGSELAVNESAAEVDVTVMNNTEQVERAEQFLKNVLSAMNLAVELKRGESEEGTVFSLIGENLGILIGKRGQTLDSLQYLTNLAANRGCDGERVRIIIDIENYRARREETLIQLAEHLAEKACRIGDEVHLEPMNRHERKIIHMALQDNRRVTTYSAGDEPRRYVVIAPKRRRRRYRDRDKSVTAISENNND